jgi:hypothetical protein
MNQQTQEPTYEAMDGTTRTYAERIANLTAERDRLNSEIAWTEWCRTNAIAKAITCAVTNLPTTTSNLCSDQPKAVSNA